MNKNYEPLVVAAAKTRQNGVASWDEFLQALTIIYSHEREACVTATPETLARVQGRALMLRELLEVMRGAPAVYEQLQKRGP